MSSERYTLGPPIGEGGMGRVHLGRLRGAEAFERTVALKCLRAELASSPERVASFLDEARMAARIRHANVVPTLDVFSSGSGELWLVMDYVPGQSLADLLQHGPLPPAICLAVFHDALAGLDAAHGATAVDGTPLDLVHRDISPHNVLVGVDGVSRIADFGIAKARNRAAVTQQQTFKGKLPYAAPEVLRSEPATPRADLYSLGVTLWEALVGRRLFTGENDGLVLFKQLESIPPLVSAAAPAVGDVFDALVAQALAKDPARRFASAREMLEALDACGRPASAVAVGRWLEDVAKDALEERAAVVRSFEATSTSDAMITIARPEPEVLALRGTLSMDARDASDQVRAAVAAEAQRARTTAPGTTRRGSSFPLAALLVALLGATVAAVGVRYLVPEAPPARPAPPAPSSPPAPTAAFEPKVEAPSLAPSEPHASRPVAKHPGAPRPKASCDPPYTVDVLGDKHYLPECFRHR